MKRKLVVLIVCLTAFSICACGSSRDRHRTTVVEEDSKEEDSKENDVNQEEDISTEEIVDEYATVDTFIEKYNAIAENPISDVLEMDIQGDDYRVEYRLRSFDSAVGKKGLINDDSIEIVNYGNSNDNIRFYVHTETLESAIEIYTNIINILDDSISDDDIIEAYSGYDGSIASRSFRFSLESYGSIDGYFDHLDGFDLFIDCDKLFFIEE